MLSVDDALGRILSAFSPLPAEPVSPLDAAGLVLARDVVASVNVPPFPNSAMDGYALRSVDTLDAPCELTVIATLAAGSVATQVVGAGQAIRIMTGAQLPDGADAVVRFEETDERKRGSTAGIVTVERQIGAGENVRLAGEDIPTGSVALPAGTRIGPAEVGVLAALNEFSPLVHRRPRVAILSTGDEVTSAGDHLEPGKIRDSNSYTIAALVRRYGGDVSLLGVARDDNRDLREKLHDAGSPDMFVTSGGVSLGDYDMVKDVLRTEGSVDVWQIRMKPGKPLAFGFIGTTPLLGLPGNPVAAMVSFEQFGRPAIFKMQGRSDVRIPEVTATLTERVENRGGRRHFVRGVLKRETTGYEVSTAGVHGSAMLTSVVRSNCYVVIPETCDVLEPGAAVTVQLPDEGI